MADVPADPDEWHFRLGVPLWLPAVKGDLTVKSHDVSPGQGAGDAFGDLSGTLDGAAALHFEAEKHNWGLLLDAMYVSLGDDITLPSGGKAEWSLDAAIGEVCGYYILTQPPPGAKGWGTFRADLLGGARVAWLKIGINESSFDEDGHQTLIDPIVGGRIKVGLLDWLSYNLRGDVGGFGISDSSSDLVWNVDTGLQFHIARWFDVDLGYRWLHYDFGDHDVSLDAMLHGPYVTATFNF